MHIILYLPLFSLLGLLIGHLLHRISIHLPLYLLQHWRHQCDVFLQLPAASHNPCKKFLRIHALLIELIAVILTIILLPQFNLEFKSWILLIFSYFLLLLSAIDCAYYLAPDCLVYPLLWLGLLFNTVQLFTTAQDAIIGASLGYSILWVMGGLFTLVFKKEGIGQGDMKVLAALGAWLGTKPLLFIILIASILGIVFGLLSMLFQNKNTVKLPFVPFLALGGWVAVLSEHARFYT